MYISKERGKVKNNSATVRSKVRQKMYTERGRNIKSRKKKKKKAAREKKLTHDIGRLIWLQRLRNKVIQGI